MDRSNIPYNYLTYTGVVLADSQVDAYNRVQERIRTFQDAGLPVPEYLVFGSCNLFKSFCAS